MVSSRSYLGFLKGQLGGAGCERYVSQIKPDGLLPVVTESSQESRILLTAWHPHTLTQIKMEADRGLHMEDRCL